WALSTFHAHPAPFGGKFLIVTGDVLWYTKSRQKEGEFCAFLPGPCRPLPSVMQTRKEVLT
ncbi:MAG: hypothetical protein LUG58_06440, partial [Clostridiales bacterium]|nr:hypothetical protein [Clostridiales bacterium]